MKNGNYRYYSPVSDLRRSDRWIDVKNLHAMPYNISRDTGDLRSSFVTLYDNLNNLSVDLIIRFAIREDPTVGSTRNLT